MRFFLGLMLFLYWKMRSKTLNVGKNCSVPDASVEILQWLAAPWSLLRGLCWNHAFHERSARSRPMSVMRGLCWNHWFRPLCACVLPDLSQIYSGFIRIRVRSRRSDKNTVKNVYEMETRFMADLCRIYSPFELFQEERPKKRLQ